MLATMDNQKFANWLLDEIKKRGWTQAELARRAKVNRQVVSTYINAKISKPDETILRLLASALNMRPEVVFRQAGLLPPAPKDVDDLEEWREILSYLSADEREELKRFGWLKIDLRRQAELRDQMNQKASRKDK